MKSGIYQIKNIVSGGIYIGRSVDVCDRLKHHKNELKRGVHRNKRLQNSWNKYGSKVFNFELIWEEEPSNLCDLEGFILENLWGNKRLYNHHKLSYGGFDIGNKIGCFPRSEETKEKIRQAFLGRIFSDEHRQKISNTKTGLKASDETRLKMSLIKKGKSRPESFLEKMRVKMAGEANPMFGKISPMRGKKFPTIPCEHCGKEVAKGNYIRWHGENCKTKG